MQLSAMLAHERTRKGVRFLVLSGTSFATNLGLTVLLHEVFGVRPDIAFGVALGAVFVMNFFIMRFYVYRASTGNVRSQLWRYALSALVFRTAEQRVFAFAHAEAWLPYPLTATVVLATSTVVKFFFWGRVVFRGDDPQGIA